MECTELSVLRARAAKGSLEVIFRELPRMSEDKRAALVGHCMGMVIPRSSYQRTLSEPAANGSFINLVERFIKKYGGEGNLDKLTEKYHEMLVATTAKAKRAAPEPDVSVKTEATEGEGPKETTTREPWNDFAV
eukprot:2760764-Prymnesium_polylepis.1